MTDVRSQRRSPRKFAPNWCFSPGVTLVEMLVCRLAEDLGMQPEEMQAIIAGQKPIPERVARLLGATLGVSKEFWLNSSSRYQAEKAEGKRDTTAAQLLSVLGVNEEDRG